MNGNSLAGIKAKSGERLTTCTALARGSGMRLLDDSSPVGQCLRAKDSLKPDCQASNPGSVPCGLLREGAVLKPPCFSLFTFKMGTMRGTTGG